MSCVFLHLTHAHASLVAFLLPIFGFIAVFNFVFPNIAVTTPS